MNRVRALLVVAAMAAVLWAVAPAPEAHAVGHTAYAYNSAGEVYVYDQGLKLRVTKGTCRATVNLKPLQYTFNAKLKKADVLANTPCGIVSVHWEGYGNLEPNGGVYRSAIATGSIGGQGYSAYGWLGISPL